MTCRVIEILMKIDVRRNSALLNRPYTHIHLDDGLRVMIFCTLPAFLDPILAGTWDGIFDTNFTSYFFYDVICIHISMPSRTEGGPNRQELQPHLVK